jgi:hypothetical protein
VFVCMCSASLFYLDPSVLCCYLKDVLFWAEKVGLEASFLGFLEGFKG